MLQQFIYVHIEGNNSVKVNLVFSKSRLVSSGKSKGQSKKEITIPQLELLAVTIGVRTANFIAKELMLLISLNLNGQQVLPCCESITTVD